MNRLDVITWGSIKDEFGYYSDSELYWAKYAEPTDGPSQIPEGGDPDLDTTSNVDPWANYQPPDTQEPEPTPPPNEVPPGSPADTLTPFSEQDMNGAQRAVGYGYDKGGNRWATEDNGVVTGYYVNAMNQYTGVGAPNNVVIGNEHEIQSYQGNAYSYINDEHLKQVTDGTNTYYLYYDALGRCVKRKLNSDSNTTYYIYDGEKPVAEYNSGGTLIARNVYGKGIDEILMRTETGVNSGNPFYYGQDHEGSVTHLIDGNPNSNFTGQVIESYKYDAFGAPTMYDKNYSPISSTAYNNRFLFTGREYAATYRGTYVPAFTFYEYRARAYNPALGRFMSEDPKDFDAGDYNLFRYCHNDPVDFSDPMGLDDTAPTYSPRQTSQQRAEEWGPFHLDWAGLQMGAIGIGQNQQFFEALNNFMKSARSDAPGADPKQIGSALVNDARQAARDHAKSIRLDQYGRRRISQERAYAEFVKKGGGLERQGPFIGGRDEQGQPYTELSFSRPPISISHSHGPESGAGLDRADVPSANGHNSMGVPYISSVGWTGDLGRTVHIYVPSGGSTGQFFHSDGTLFVPGP